MTKEGSRLFAFISPPQNATKEGMGADLFRSNPDFSNIVTRVDKLTSVYPLDPGLGYSSVVFAIAAYSALVAATGIYPDVLAGFSVGENATFVQSGAIGLEHMTKSLIVREKLTGMGRAEAANRHMIAFRGVSLEGEDQQEALSKFLIQDPHLKHLHLANITGPFDGVLSGEVEDADGAVHQLRGLSRGPLAYRAGKVSATRLQMPDAFHSIWMQDQEKELKKRLGELNIIGGVNTPSVGRVYSPMMRGWLDTPEGVYKAITEQLTRRVDVRSICEEIRGSKFVITADPIGITSKILENNGIENVFNISDAASFESVAEMLRAAAQ